jgi:putative oxidoreductase
LSNRYYIPALGRVYQQLEPLAYPLLRVVGGFIFMMHGAARLRFIDIGGSTVESLAKLNAQLGFQPAYFWSVYITGLELIGGLLIFFGLFTRFAAFLLCGFMFVGTFYVTIGNGFFARGPQGTGWEYTLVLLALTLAYLVRGGGPFSIDRAIGREL